MSDRRRSDRKRTASVRALTLVGLLAALTMAAPAARATEPRETLEQAFIYLL